MENYLINLIISKTTLQTLPLVVKVLLERLTQIISTSASEPRGRAKYNFTLNMCLLYSPRAVQVFRYKGSMLTFFSQLP